MIGPFSLGGNGVVLDALCGIVLVRLDATVRSGFKAC